MKFVYCTMRSRGSFTLEELAAASCAVALAAAAVETN